MEKYRRIGLMFRSPLTYGLMALIIMLSSGGFASSAHAASTQEVKCIVGRGSSCVGGWMSWDASGWNGDTNKNYLSLQALRPQSGKCAYVRFDWKKSTPSTSLASSHFDARVVKTCRVGATLKVSNAESPPGSGVPKWNDVDDMGGNPLNNYALTGRNTWAVCHDTTAATNPKCASGSYIPRGGYTLSKSGEEWQAWVYENSQGTFTVYGGGDKQSFDS